MHFLPKYICTRVVKKGMRSKLFLHFLMASADDLLPFWVIGFNVTQGIDLNI